MVKSIIAGIVASSLCTLAIADDGAKLVGTWKLVSFETEFQDGSPRRAVLGANPKGYMVFTPEARQLVLIEGDGRKPPTTDEERAALFRSMIAWTGSYRIDGDKMTLKVDGSWNPAVTGTERVSTLRFEGDRVHFVSPWAPSPTLGTAGAPPPITRGVTVWERSK